MHVCLHCACMFALCITFSTANTCGQGTLQHPELINLRIVSHASFPGTRLCPVLHWSFCTCRMHRPSWLTVGTVVT